VFDGAGGAGQGGFNGDPFAGFGFNPGNMGGANFDIDLEDILGSFFGGERVRKKTKNGNDIQIIMDVSLKDSFVGINRKITFRTFVSCEKCNGLGYDKSAGTETCKKCNGTGQIKEQKRTIFGNVLQVKECEKCYGSGKSPKKICKDCDGAGRVMGKKSVDVEIKAGVYDGQIVKIIGQGEAGIRGEKSGDLYIKIHIITDDGFNIVGDNLLFNKTINIAQILSGDPFYINHPDGTRVEVKIPHNHDLQDDIIIKGKGIARRGQAFGYSNSKRGDLIVKLHVKTPKKISKKMKELAKELEKEEK